jgi:hypothetical protein
MFIVANLKKRGARHCPVEAFDVYFWLRTQWINKTCFFLLAEVDVIDVGSNPLKEGTKRGNAGCGEIYHYSSVPRRENQQW